MTKNNVFFIFNFSCQKTFSILKKKLISVSILIHYNLIKKIWLKTDFSNSIVEAIMLQKQTDDQWHLIVYFFKIMHLMKCNYFIHDKKMLTIIQILKEWQAELTNLFTIFDILIDHQVLEYFMIIKKLSFWQAKWAELLSQFYFIIKYRLEKLNILINILTQ